MTDRHIESPQNPRIKAWRALRSRSERDATGLFLIEGERETLRGAEHLELVNAVLREDRTDVSLPHTVTVSQRAFDRLSVRENPDGVAGIFRAPPHGLDAIDPVRPALVLIADSVEKPGNIGAMIRTADAFGAAFVGASLGTDLYNPNVVRAAQGSLFAVPTASATRSETITWSQGQGRIVITSPDADESLWNVDLTGPTSIVVGSEHVGVDSSWLNAGIGCRIPTEGHADSLNASVAAAVVLAEARRQRSA